MTEPLVTVFICSFNKARFVEAALESVERQTFRDFELIVVDDLSTDSSVSIITNWIYTTRKETTFIQHTENIGVTRTINEILRIATGKLIASLGADDVWHPGFLEEFVARMQELPEEVAVLYGDAEVIDEDGRLSPIRFIDTHRHLDHRPDGRIFYTLLEGNFIPSMAALNRVDCIRAVGGYDESLFFEDWDMLLRLADKYLFSFFPGALVQYRVVHDSMARSEALRPRMDESTKRIYLKWIGRDERSARIVEKALGLPEAAEFLYEAGHPTAYRYLRWKFRADKAARTLILMGCARVGMPYSNFRRIDYWARAAKGSLRRAFTARGNG